MLPKKLQDIHLIGIAGTGMGAFAGLLKQAGYNVRGSDQNAYPPMSNKLADWQIPVATPYDENNLQPHPGRFPKYTGTGNSAADDNQIPFSGQFF